MTTKKSLRGSLLAQAGTIVSGILVATLAAGLSGCRPDEEPGVHVASWAMVDARERHPIVVSNEPASLSLRIQPSAFGLTPSQRAQAIDFFRVYRGTGSNAGRLSVAAPSGGANEVAVVRAIADLRLLSREAGIEEVNVTVRAYRSGRDASAPITIGYARFVAEAPECGAWPDNLASDRRNLPYAKFGCASQRNLAVQVANPADLLGPRGMTPSNADRRDAVFDKYVKGVPSHATKSSDEKLDPIAK